MSAERPRRVVAIAASLVVLLVVGLVAVLASRSPGYATAAVQTTQRAAWVSSDRDLMVGLLNRQTDQVQSPAYLDAAGGLLLQQDDAVGVVDRRAHTLRMLDPVDVVFSAKLTLPDRADVALSTSTVAVADQADGRLWALPLDGFDGGDLTGGEPLATAGAGAVVTVIGDRVVAAVPGSDRITVVSAATGTPTAVTVTVPGGALSAADPTAAADTPPPDGAAPSGPLEISSVGDVPVVLDRPAHRLVLLTAAGARSVDLGAPADGARLQQPGPAADEVLVAEPGALLRVGTADGAVTRTEVPGTATPAAPVRVGSCLHAAWLGSSPTYLTSCGGAAPSTRPIGRVDGAAALVFRVNHGTVVLNDVTTGNSWVLDDDLTLVNNWDQIRSSPADLANSDAGSQGSANTLTAAQQPCTDKPLAPVAKNDAYGIRPGRPRVLHVLDNDQSSTCSVPVITTARAPEGSGAEVTVVDGGTALQVTLPAAATAPVAIRYSVSDGISGESSATATVTPQRGQRPEPPVSLRESTAAMTVRGTLQQDVLGTWDSPSGDTLFLVGARSSVPSDRVSTSPDGTITVVDSGATGATKKAVTYQVSDGVNTVDGTLSIEVVDEDRATPVAGPVHATGAVGSPLVIHPLEHVLWPGLDQLVLAKVAAQKDTSGISVTPDADDGTVTVTAARPGTYYLDYQVAVGDKDSSGKIRVDIAADADGAAPVTTTDTAYLPQNGDTLVDLTANDVAPGGGIVAVQQLTVPPGSGLVARMSDMHLAQLTSRRPLPAGGVWVPYEASAGGTAATGWLHVVPVPRPSEPVSPSASAISVSVRAGDAVTIPIADHARDPGGDAVTPVAFPDDAIGAADGLLFATDDAIRYQAPDDGATAAGRTLRTQYTVRSTTGRTASANLTITVVPTGPNQAPRTPPTAQARVFARGTTQIPLPLDGIDPDGDWAIVQRIDSAPELGAATPTGPSSLTYTAFDRPGTDTVRYIAADPFGGTVIGTVQVLVVPLPTTADPPVVPDLAVTVAPRRSVAVNVLDEVTDPGGLAVRFPSSGALQLPSGSPGVQARTRDRSVVITAGSSPTTVPIQVTAENVQQRTGSGTLTVTVDPDAPPVPPTASDVLVTQEMTGGTDTATVDLSPWVANPGGLPEDLRATVPAVSRGTLRVTGARAVSVPVTNARQVIAYQVSTPEKLTAEAFLIVPSRAELGLNSDPRRTGPQTPTPETLVPKALRPLVVDAGRSYDVRIADYIGGAKTGRTLSVPTGAPLRASVGSLTRLSATTVRWQVPEDAGGGAQLVLTVTDGVADPAQASIRATIRPAKPAAPVFQGTSISVEAGTTAAPVPLLPLVTYDPEKKSTLQFSGPTGGAAGITGQLRGGALVVAAAPSAAKGTSATFTLTVTDRINPPVSARFTVTVTGSDKQLARLAPRTLEVAAGQQGQVDVLAGASNPFPTPLTLLSVGEGRSYQVSFDAGGTVRVTPDADFSGTLTLPLVVADATGDPDRRVSGALTVVVRGVPDAPGAPAQLSVTDGQAVIQWTQPDDNGSPITGYSVRGSGGFQQDCPRSPCRLQGLRNNTSYVFTVVARNAVGQSPASPASAPIRPDTAPDPVGAPALAFGDRSLAASWRPARSEGSPVTAYELQLVPGGRTVRVPSSARSYTYRALANGTAYTLRVRALNSSGTPGDWSPGATETPATAPGSPTAVELSAAQDAGSSRRIDVSWTPGSSGGDAPDFRVVWSAGGGASGALTVPAGTTTARIPDAQLGTTYSVQVIARNKAGNSAPSQAATVTPYTPPDRIDDLAAAATGTDNQVQLTWSPPADNGRKIVQYEYTDGKNGWRAVPGLQTSFTPPDLANGTSYAFQVRACSDPDGNGSGFTCGTDSAVAQASPYGPPRDVTNLAADPDAPGAGKVALSWAAPADDGGRPIAGYRYTVDGGAAVDVGAATTTTVEGLQNGQQHTFVVYAYTAEQQANQSPGATVQATPYDVPGAPGNLRATGGENAVTLVFDAPASTGGRDISQYQHDVDGNGNWQPVASGQPFAVGDWNAHTYRVRAVNRRGPGPESNTAQASAYGPVGQVRNPQHVNKDSSVDFSWDPPAGNGINGWYYLVDGQRQNQQTASKSGGCSADVSISVVAVDAQGHQGPARTISGRTTGSCGAVQLKHGGSRPCETGGGTCYYLAMNYQNIPSGTYSVCFHFDNAGAGCWRQYSGRQLGGDGSFSSEDVNGYNSAHYGNNQNTDGWVEISGPQGTFRSPTVNWRNL